MSRSRADEAALKAFPLDAYKPDEVLRIVYARGYEQAEKDVIERACEWLKENVTYIHPRKDTKACIVNLNVFREAMEKQE